MKKREQITKFMSRNDIQISRIMYMTRNDRKTVIHLKGGRSISTFHAIKQLLEVFPEDSFKVINKGIAVSPMYIDRIEKNRYTMVDGSSFIGRVRSFSEHRENAMLYSRKNNIYGWDAFSVIDDMPIAFCIIELLFDENNCGIDFIFRYCNKAMEELEGKSLEELMDRSFYSIFDNADKKWLITYADVAMHGGSRIIESYSPEIDATLRIYCFQPKPNFCACAMIKKEDITVKK